MSFIPILLIAVLFSVIYPLYNAFAESSDNAEADNTEEETKDEVECNDDEELKDGDCVPISTTSGGTPASVPSSTVLKLDSISDVKPGDPIEVKGSLMDDTSDEGIDNKEIKLAVTGIEDLPTEKTATKTDGDGKFTFTIPSNVPIEVDSVKFKAHFEGEPKYLKSDSNEVTYERIESTPTTKTSTSLTLNPISDVNPAEDILVEGTLKSPDGTGINDKEITLAVTGIEDLPTEKTATKTDGDGKFTFTIPSNVPNEPTLPALDKPPIGAGSLVLNKPLIEVDSVKFKAHFEGDDDYEASESNEVTYARGSTPNSKIATVLNLQELSDVNPGEDILVEGTLTGDRTGLDSRIITLAVTGIEVLPTEKTTTETDMDGKFTFTIPDNIQRDFAPLVRGNAPVERDSLTFQAHFEGDDYYEASESNVVTNEPRGTSGTVLVLDAVSKDSAGVSIDGKGTLMDYENDEGIGEKPIELTVSPLRTGKVVSDSSYNAYTGGVVSDSSNNARTECVPSNSQGSTTTSDNGEFIFNGIRAPPEEAFWKVQAHFNGDSVYGRSCDSRIIVTAKDVIQVNVPEILLQQKTDEKEAGTERTILDASSLKKCNLLNITDKHNDELNEIELKGNHLIYNEKDNTKQKTIEYSIFFDCQGEPPKSTDPEKPGTGPGAPLIKSPTAGTSKTAISQISGTAEAGSKVEVFNGGTSLGTTPAGNDGNWLLTLGTPLGDGTYSFTTKATDAASNTGPASSAVEVIVDATGPGAPVIKSPTAGTRNIGITGISGTAEAGSKVEVFNGGTSLGTTPAGNDGNWLLTLIDSLWSGTYSITAKATDAASNTGPASSAVEVVVDATGPTVNASPTGGTFEVDQSVTLSSPDADIDKIYFTTDGSEPDNTDAEFTDNISVSAATGTTTTITIKFIGYDTLGNAGPVGSETYIIDKQGPTVTAKRSCEPCDPGEILRIVLLSDDPDIDINAIYYTTDGTNPSSSSGTHYTGPVDLSQLQWTPNSEKGVTVATLKFMGYDKLVNDGPVGVFKMEMPIIY